MTLIIIYLFIVSFIQFNPSFCSNRSQFRLFCVRGTKIFKFILSTKYSSKLANNYKSNDLHQIYLLLLRLCFVSILRSCSLVFFCFRIPGLPFRYPRIGIREQIHSKNSNMTPYNCDPNDIISCNVNNIVCNMIIIRQKQHALVIKVKLGISNNRLLPVPLSLSHA